MPREDARQARPCEACGRHISFVQTASGGAMPCDAFSLVTILDDDGVIRRGWIPHWTTCSDPSRFRSDGRRRSGNVSQPTSVLARQISSEISAIGEISTVEIRRDGLELIVRCQLRSSAISSDGESQAPSQRALAFDGDPMPNASSTPDRADPHVGTGGSVESSVDFDVDL